LPDEVVVVDAGVRGGVLVWVGRRFDQLVAGGGGDGVGQGGPRQEAGALWDHRVRHLGTADGDAPVVAAERAAARRAAVGYGRRGRVEDRVDGGGVRGAQRRVGAGQLALEPA